MKRPTELIIKDPATGLIGREPSQEDISRVMADMGRKGGKVGGLRRAQVLTQDQRRDQAIKAARARWDKVTKPTGLKTHKCDFPECKYACGGAAPLGRHKRDAHGINGSSHATVGYHKIRDRKLVCDVCGAGPFKVPAALGSHKRNIHSIAGTSANSNTYKDTVKLRLGQTLELPENPETVLDRPSPLDKKICSICGDGPFKNPSGLGAHKRRIHGVHGTSEAYKSRRRREERENSEPDDQTFHGVPNVTLSKAAELFRGKGFSKPEGVSLYEAILALEAKRDAINEVISTLKEMQGL